MTSKVKLFSTNANDHSVTVNGDENLKTKKTRKHVIVIRDSLLNGIEDYGPRKHHNGKVCPHPGAKTSDIVDHVKQVARGKPEMVMIYCGSYDLTNDVDTTKHMKEFVLILKEETPHTQIV